MLRSVTKKDIEFLKNLQHEMLTQETDYEAPSRYWVVAQHERNYGCAADCSYGSSMFDPSAAELVGDTVDEVKKHVSGYYDFEFDEEDEEVSEIIDLEDLAKYLNKNLEDGFYVSYYSLNHSVQQEGTFFLTKRECQEHIKYNRHHYNETVHTYANTIFRSPQVEKLYEILENVDFSTLEVKQ